MAKRRAHRILSDARLAPPPTLAPYGLGAVTTICAPIAPGRAVRVCVTRSEKLGKKLEGPEDVCRLLRGAVNADREAFYAIHLDTKNHVLGIEEVAKGALDWVQTTPRETFKAAIIGQSAAIILAHNHPSGSSEPSDADITLTDTMIKVGKLIGIPVRDHVIVAAGGCRSLRTTDAARGFGRAHRRR